MKNNCSIIGNVCCGCGTCSAICPQSSISMILKADGFYNPLIAKEKCTYCGLCLRVCPMFEYPRLELEKKPENPDYVFMSGHSIDKEQRKESASGGILTELLCDLIEHAIVDKVLVVRGYEKQQRPYGVILDSAAEIKSCAKSVYYPVPVNENLKLIKHTSEKLAVVALPCQVQGIRLLQKNSKWAKDNIKYVFSLFCNHMPSAKATEFLIYNLSIEHPIDYIKYRGGGWPGFLSISNNKKKVTLPYRKTVTSGFGQYPAMYPCEFCMDHFGSNADASFADAYFLQNNIEEMGDGQTFIIDRTEEKMIGQFLKKSNNIKVDFIEGLEKEIALKSYSLLVKKHAKSQKVIIFFELIRIKVLGVKYLKSAIRGKKYKTIYIAIKLGVRILFKKFQFMKMFWRKQYRKYATKSSVKDCIKKEVIE